MSSIKAIAILLITCILLTGCSTAVKNKDGSPKEEESKYKVGDILDAPEKVATFDKISEITIYEESEDKSHSSVVSMKKTDSYTIYSAEQNLGSGNTIKKVTYQIGDTYIDYHSFNGEWYQIDYDPESAITLFAYKGFDTERPLVTNGYEKLEDTVIDGKEYYTYKVSETFNEEYGKGGDLRICVDKESGMWMYTENSYGGTVIKNHITSVEYEYKNPLKLCDPAIIPEQTIYESNDIIITVKNTETADPKIASTLVFEVNNTTQNDIRIFSHKLLINGLFLGQNIVNGEVKAGSTGEITVDIPSSSTMLSDIYTIKDINVNLKIDNVSYTVTDSTLVEDTGSLKIKTEGTEDFNQQVNKDGTLVFDEKGVKLVFRDLVKLDSGNTFFRFYVENDFSELIRVRFYLHKINGIEFDDSCRFRVASDSYGINGFTIHASDLSQFESIDSIEFDYAVYYNDMDFSSISYSDTLTLFKSDSPITITIE